MGWKGSDTFFFIIPLCEINIFEFPGEGPDPSPSRNTHASMHLKFYERTSIKFSAPLPQKNLPLQKQDDMSDKHE